MNGTWTRRCHKCDNFFQADTKHGEVCPSCSAKNHERALKRKRRIVPAKTLYEARMRAIKNLII